MIFNGTTTRIPEELLLAHQEGKVVFFCGAGISHDAGIPLWSKLVSDSARVVGMTLAKKEQALLRQGYSDVVYQNLERRIGTKNRLHLRGTTASLLKPKKSCVADEELTYHFALLKLSVTHKDERLHLVTTNYDELFDIAEQHLRKLHGFSKSVKPYSAPLLPVPKESKWDGLIYLHGKLDGTSSADNLNSLVLSSGDFGVAYLTERWASRFVTELFRTYTICFVGYSANDAIIRYILDAFSADSLIGEQERKLYAFDGYEDGGIGSLEESWRMRGVEVVPFRKGNQNDYSELKRTLTAWSDYYSSGVNGSARIILDDATRLPLTVNKEDKAGVERVLWALKEPNGNAGEQFCELEPLPSLEWFDVIRDATIADLRKYWSDVGEGKGAVPPRELIPVSYKPIVYHSTDSILAWLAKYLNDPMLLRKVCTLPRPLSPKLIDFIEGKILAAKQDAIDPALRNLWLVWLESERLPVKSFYVSNEDECLRILKSHRECTGRSKQLANLIMPCLDISPSSMWEYIRQDNVTPRLHDLVSWDYKIGAYSVVSRNSLPDGALLSLPSSLLSPIEDALNHLCEMRRELGEEDDESDFNSLSLQDVSGPVDEANDHYPEWATLVVLLRNVWVNLLKENHAVATSVAQKWFTSKHPIFKRLALFAATQDTSMDSDQVVLWLIERKERLFGTTYCREIVDFLAVRGNTITPSCVKALDEALSVPPERYSKNGCIYHRALLLDRLIDAGVRLPDSARCFYDDWTHDKPEWKDRQKKYDGLAHWVSDSHDATWEDATSYAPAKMPDDDDSILMWLLDEYEKVKDVGYELRKDEWRDLCRNDVLRAHRILTDSFERDFKLKNALGVFWIEAAQKDRAKILWDVLRCDNADNVINLKIVTEAKLELVAKWFCALSEQGVDVDAYLNLGRLLIDLTPYDENVDGRGHKKVMEGVLRRWYATDPKEGCGIVSPFREFFTFVASGGSISTQNARKELLTQLSNLTLVDKEWTFGALTPCLSWKKQGALEAWKSAIKMTWRNVDLMEHIKSEFTETASHYNELGEGGRWYTQIVLLMATAKNKGYGAASYRRILQNLPDEGRVQIAKDILNRLHNSLDKIDANWNDEIGPFVTQSWPADEKYMTPEIAGLLFEGVAYCNASFHEAAQSLLKLYGGNIALRDVAARLAHPPKDTPSRCRLYPDDVLDILSRVDTSKSDVATALNIEECLDEMYGIPLKTGERTYETDERYQRLLVFVKAR